MVEKAEWLGRGLDWDCSVLLALAFAGCVVVGGSPFFNCRDKEAEEGSSTSFAKSFGDGF